MNLKVIFAANKHIYTYKKKEIFSINCVKNLCMHIHVRNLREKKKYDENEKKKECTLKDSPAL
jgi:hypothetical protein